MATIEEVRELAASEQGLCVVSTTRADHTVHSSVVNAGPLAHPISGAEVFGLVARGRARKVGLIKTAGRASITYRRGWRWASIEGPAGIVASDADAGSTTLAQLLRRVFTAAGGTHDNWDEFDQVMAHEKRVAILLHPSRVIGNG